MNLNIVLDILIGYIRIRYKFPNQTKEDNLCTMPGDMRMFELNLTPYVNQHTLFRIVLYNQTYTSVRLIVFQASVTCNCDKRRLKVTYT